MSLLTRFLFVSALVVGVTCPRASAAQSNSGLPKVHASAPPLHLQEVLGGGDPARAELTHLRGKVVVLEFWATWCVPCIGEIPAINALVPSLDPAKVQFLSITDEEPVKVQSFLKKHPMSGWIGFDTTGSVFERYGVAARPATVVIDPQGRVVSNDVTPDRLTRAQLLALAAGRSRTVKAESHGESSAKVDEARSAAMKEQFDAAGAGNLAGALFTVNITHGGSGKPHLYLQGSESYDILNAPLETLVQFGLGYGETLIGLQEGAFVKQTYNLSVHATDVPEQQLKAVVELAIESATGTRIEHRQAEEDVQVLQPARGGNAVQAGKQIDSGLAGYDPKLGMLTMVGAAPRQIARVAGDILGTPIVNEAGDVPACSGSVKIAKRDLEALRTNLEQQCGMTLSPGRRIVDRVRISPDPNAQPRQ